MPFTDVYTRLNKLISTLEPSMQRAFLDAIAVTKNSLGTLKEIEQLMVTGQLDAALARAIEPASIILADAQANIYITAGQAGAKAISKGLEVVVDFDQVNERAVQAIRNNRLELIRNFTEEQINVTRQALIEGTTRGLNPREQARNFRDNIGLTARQQRAVLNYREALESNSDVALDRKLRDKRFDGTLQRAIDNGTPLSTSQINRMVSRYQERYIKYRSEVISRTETLRGVHEGNEEAYAQAIDQGVLQPDQIRRKWVSAKDKRVRDSHKHLNGTVIKFGEVFNGKHGDLRFPGDPKAPGIETIQCRCAVTTRMV